MYNKYENETEEANSFLADVYYYMQEHECTRGEAEEIVYNSYYKKSE
jgi:hypothetical protein